MTSIDTERRGKTIFKKLGSVFRKNSDKQYYTIKQIHQMFQGERLNYQLDVDKFLSTAYQNPYISACFETLINAMQNIDWNTYKKGHKDNLTRTDRTKVAKTIARPSMLTNQDEFISHLMLNYILDGECLVRKVDLLHRLDLIIYKKGGYSYKIKNTNGDMELRINGELIPEDKHKDFYIFKKINIYSYIAGSGQGRSSLESIVLLHDFYCLIMKWNNETMENNGGNSYAFLSEDSLNPDEKKEIYDKYKKDTRKKGLPLIIDGSTLKIQSMSDTKPSDFDYINGLYEVRSITASVLGVPSLLIGDSRQTTYNNLREAKEAMYTETILPIADRIKEMLNHFMGDDLETNEIIDYDTERIEVLQEKRNEKLKMLATISGIFTTNETREQVGYPAVKGGDKILVNPMLVPIDEVGITEEPPKSEEETDTEVINGEEEEPEGNN